MEWRTSRDARSENLKARRRQSLTISSMSVTAQTDAPLAQTDFRGVSVTVRK